MNVLQRVRLLFLRPSTVQPKHEPFQSLLRSLERIDIASGGLSKDERKLLKKERQKIIKDFAYHERHSARAANKDKFNNNLVTQFYNLHTQMNSIRELFDTDPETFMNSIEDYPMEGRLAAKRLFMRYNEMIAHFSEAINTQLIHMIEDYENGFED